MTDARNARIDCRDQAERFCAYIPHVRALGMSVSEAWFDPKGVGEAVMNLPWRDELIGDPLQNQVHTGALVTVVDSAAGFAVMCAMGGELRTIATLDLRLDYLRPGQQGAAITTRATCYRMTANVAFVRADVEQSGNRLAQAVATFMIGSSRSRSKPND